MSPTEEMIAAAVKKLLSEGYTSELATKIGNEAEKLYYTAEAAGWDITFDQAVEMAKNSLRLQGEQV